MALAAARCRIGIDVAKAKFDSESWTYCRLVGEGQIEDVMSLLTNEIVEKAVIERVMWRATFKAQGLVPGDGGLVGGVYTQVSDPLVGRRCGPVLQGTFDSNDQGPGSLGARNTRQR